MADAVSMFLGETRKIEIKVESTDRKKFEITNAKFKLVHVSGVEADGECGIEPSGSYAYILSALVSPLIKCSPYIVRFSYDVHPEHLIFEVPIRVK